MFVGEYLTLANYKRKLIDFLQFRQNRDLPYCLISISLTHINVILFHYNNFEEAGVLFHLLSLEVLVYEPKIYPRC